MIPSATFEQHPHDMSGCDEELVQLLQLAADVLQASSGFVAWLAHDPRPWLSTDVRAPGQPAIAQSIKQHVLQQCQQAPGQVVHGELTAPTCVAWSAAGLRAYGSARVRGVLCVLYQHSLAELSPDTRAEAQSLLVDLGKLAVRALEVLAHLATRLAADNLPVPAALQHLVLPLDSPLAHQDTPGVTPDSTSNPVSKGLLDRLQHFLKARLHCEGGQLSNAPPPTVSTQLVAQVDNTAAATGFLDDATSGRFLLSAEKIQQTVHPFQEAQPPLAVQLAQQVAPAPAAKPVEVPLNVLIMSGVQRQRANKQDLLTACTLVVDTHKPGWPVMFCGCAWKLWSGMPKNTMVGLLLQDILTPARPASALLRWQHLQALAQAGQPFAVCDIATRAAASPSGAQQAGMCAGPPRGHEPGLEDLLQLLMQREPSAVWPGATSMDILPAADAVQQEPQATYASLPTAMPDPGIPAAEMSEQHAASVTDSTCILGNRFDVSFVPLGRGEIKPADSTCSAKGLYAVHIHIQGCLQLPDEHLTAKVKVRPPVTINELVSGFWPHLKKLDSLRHVTSTSDVLPGVWHQAHVTVQVQDLSIKSPEDMRQFQLEVMLGQRLSHPNLVHTLSHAVVEIEPKAATIKQQADVASGSIWLLDEDGTERPLLIARCDASTTGPAGRRLRCLHLMEACEAGTWQECVLKGWLWLPHMLTSSDAAPNSSTASHGATWQQCMDAFQVLCVAHDVCSALHHLHGQGVVHVGLSAGNVLLTQVKPRTQDMQQYSRQLLSVWERCDAKHQHLSTTQSAPVNLDRHWLQAQVSNFASARRLGPDGKAQVTRLGAPAYTAPEVLAQRRASPAADMYSFGVLIWQACHKRPAWPGVLPEGLIQLVVSGKCLEWQDSTWPHGLAALGQACCDPDPSRRPSASAALTELHKLMEGLGQAASEAAS